MMISSQQLQVYVVTYFYVMKRNSVALFCKQTIQTERLPLVGELNANFLRIEGVAWSARRIPTAVNLDFLDPEPLLLHSNSSSVILTRPSGSHSRPTTSQKIW
jgi:hypothetical protein